MVKHKLIPLIVGLTFVSLLAIACGASVDAPEPVSPTAAATSPPSSPSATPTPAPPPATPTPLPPTATPTPDLPPATPAPAAGIGVPVVSQGWLVTINDVQHQTEVSRTGLTRMPNGGLGIELTTHYPADGNVFLVVDGTFRRLDPLAQSSVGLEDVTLVSESGKRYSADEISQSPREFDFQIEEDATDQVFELHFLGTPLSAFTAGQASESPPAIEIGAEPGVLPAACTVEALPALGDAGGLTFLRHSEAGLVLGLVDPDGPVSTPACSGVAYGDLQLAVDGAALLLLFPHHGWPSLYLVEPDGQVYRLVNNGLNIAARFDPSGRWVLFATESPGQTGQELYTFDRDSASTNVVKAGEQVTFDFLTDGRLIIDYQETEDSERQLFVGPPDGNGLEPLELPEDISSYAFVSDDGQNLVYREIDPSFSSFSLFIADLDGDNARELAQSSGLRLYYALAHDSQAILMGIGQGDAGDRVELRHLETDQSWTIATGVDDADLSFSPDGQWAAVATTEGDRHTLYVIRVADGGVQVIENALNAFFSPDSSRLAYTARQQNGEEEIFVTPLEAISPLSLEPGVVTGWFPQQDS